MRIRCRSEPLATLAAFDGNETKTLGGKETSGSGCNNVNMLYFTTEVTVILTSRPRYTTTSRDVGRETPIVQQISYTVSCAG